MQGVEEIGGGIFKEVAWAWDSLVVLGLRGGGGGTLMGSTGVLMESGVVAGSKGLSSTTNSLPPGTPRPLQYYQTSPDPANHSWGQFYQPGKPDGWEEGWMDQGVWQPHGGCWQDRELLFLPGPVVIITPLNPSPTSRLTTSYL